MYSNHCQVLRNVPAYTLARAPGRKNLCSSASLALLRPKRLATPPRSATMLHASSKPAPRLASSSEKSNLEEPKPPASDAREG